MSKVEKDLAKQANLEIERQTRKQQALDTLRDEPNNLSAIKTMAKISRQEGDIGEEQKYLYRRLEIEPDKPKILIQLIRLAKNNNDIEEIRRLRRQLKSMQPSRASEIKAAISVAAVYRDTVSYKMLHKQLEDFMKRNDGMSLQETAEESKTMQAAQASALEKEILERTNGEKVENPIQEARRIIYEGEDISKAAETIKKLLDGQDPTETAVVLAELYLHTGMRERAEKSLKAYKRTLENNDSGSSARIVNQAIELTRNKKTLQYKWEEFWNAIEEKKKQFPSSPGEDERER